MKTTRRILWGVILIALGILWILDLCSVITFELFFDGWWTLFIIVPCLIGLITEHDKLGNLFGLCVGVGLLLACQDIIAFDLLWKLLIPLIVILIGVRMIFKDVFTRKAREAKAKAEEKIHAAGGEVKEYCATFSTLDVDFDGQTFYGVELTAVFGGVKCDLRNAVIVDDAVVSISSVFGGIEILLPDNVNVRISSTSVFGGIDNKHPTGASEIAPTVHVSGSCVFGGAEIK